MITTVIAIGSFVVAVASAIIAAWSVRYARRSATAAEGSVREANRSANAAEQALDLERQKLQAETEHIEFRSYMSGDTVYVTQSGNGTARNVTFTRNLHPAYGTPASDWPKGHSEGFIYVAPSIGDNNVAVPTVSWTDSDGELRRQPVFIL